MSKSKSPTHPAGEKKKNTPLETSFAERNEMFSFWYDANRNYSAAANKFGIAITTIRRYAKADKWESRAADIDKKIRDQVDKEVARAQVSNVRIANAIMLKELAAYNKRKRVTGNPYVILSYMRYIDNADDPAPPPPPAAPVPAVLGVLPPDFYDSLSAEQKALYDADITAALERRGTARSG